MTVRIGIDIGGTFTDLQIVDTRNGVQGSVKTPTTPEDPSLGLMTGIETAAARFGFATADVSLLLHGTTIATNAVLERKLPRGVLVTTSGFRDVLEIGRHVRRDIYGLRPLRPDPLIPRDRRIEVAERIRADGTVEQAMTEQAMNRVLDTLRVLQAETVAICLLNANADSTHERRLRDHLLAAWPGLPVSISSEVSPEIREYERTSTTVLNALLVPVLRAYLAQLAHRMESVGLRARLLLVQSNGGVCSAAVAGAQPVRLLLSGPSGGALAAERLSQSLALPDLVGIDMGGTSFDVCVVQASRVTQMMQGEVDGLPVRLPMVEIRTIGAGGGSIAAVDSGGRFVVGPRSAGARPGPACYGRGGTSPTVTDANLVLGRLDGAFFLGGALPLDAAAACEAVQREVASPLALGVEQAAEGILAVTNASLAAAIRLSLFERGLDPRSFALLSFGGAGGLHAIPVAEELGVTRVVFPADASTFSAGGILRSDIVHDLTSSRLMPALPSSLPALGTAADGLLRQAELLFADDRTPPDRQRLGFAADMRYHGQAFELTVPWPALVAGSAPDRDALATLVAAFHALHKQRFTYDNPDDKVEIVALRLTATGLLPPVQSSPTRSVGAVRQRHARQVFLTGAWHDTPVLNRSQLTAPMPGPMLIEEDDTTVLLPSGWSCAPGPENSLIATKAGVDA